MDTKKITEEMKAKLDAPLPAEAVKPHPAKADMSTINAIYVTERLNDVFGVGAWRVKSEFIAEKPFVQQTKNGPKNKIMIVTKTVFEIPEYGIYYECYGGNDNDDLGDAYKGSTTDAITKIGSYLGIGAEVWKEKSKKQQGAQQQQPRQQATQQPRQQAPQQQAVPPQRRTRVIEYLEKLDDLTFASFQASFQFEAIKDLTDAQINAIANYLNANKR